ncbi:beta-1,3-glucosyltransferase [Euwallacea fornicatus]|uniref:beta-1,3-glucosyltransferase n=1 Tax=Euwallacea fornicatus TaxID=995702 RepID=UPI00338E3985
MRYVFLLLCGSFLLPKSSGIDNATVTYVIIDQRNPYGERLAGELETHLKEQYEELKLDEPQIWRSHDLINSPASWTISPLIVPVWNLLGGKTAQWVVFLQDFTAVVVHAFLNELTKYDHHKEVWIGHALHDAEASIIHHFAFHENPQSFKYPNAGSAVAISVPLLEKLKTRIEQGVKQLDFHIDAAHELALFIYNDGRGPMIEHNDKFCESAEDRGHCATYPKKFTSCREVTSSSSIFFAIKTCQQFHVDRVEAVKQTWYQYAEKKAFFSDAEDVDVPTISLNIPNTEHGHCAKTMGILRYLVKEFHKDPALNWLALVDDDTILSVKKVVELTTCHDNASLPMILGERYLFGMQGFNYPTGGAGIIINRAALKILTSKCVCPRDDSPDDMVLGSCAEDLGITLVHVSQMHQARPEDYAPGRLATKDAITFHKHWMIDPVEVYRNWFLEADIELMRGKLTPKTEF